MRMYSAIGRAIPIHCSAIGKSLLLNMDDKEILELLEKFGMKSFTPFTITSPEALIAQIHEARLKGYTVDNGEHENRVCCLAVPIYDYRGDIIAAISTAAHRIIPVDQDELIRLLKQTSKQISERLGGTLKV